MSKIIKKANLNKSQKCSKIVTSNKEQSNDKSIVPSDSHNNNKQNFESNIAKEKIFDQKIYYIKFPNNDDKNKDEENMKNKIKELTEKNPNLYLIEKIINKEKNFFLYDKNAKFIETKNRFYTKEKAEIFIKESKNNDLYLFGEDVSDQGRKLFIVATKKEIYEFSKQKIYSLYEYYNINQKIRLFYDIDIDYNKIKLPDGLNDYNEYNEAVLSKIIELTKKELLKYTKEIPKIIFLTSHRENKLSTHIIFQNIVFENISLIGNFVKMIIEKNSKLFIKGVIDTSIYGNKDLRLLWNSKYGKNNIIDFNNFDNYYCTNNEEERFYDAMVLPQNNNYIFINYKINLNNKKNINQNDTAENINKNNNQENTIDALKLDIPKEMLIELLNILSEKRRGEYETWIEIVYICRNYCLYDEIIDISRRSGEFNNNSIKIIDEVFKKPIPTYCFKINKLYEWCILDNSEKYFKIINKYEKIKSNKKININSVSLVEIKKFLNLIDKKRQKKENKCDKIGTIIKNCNINGFILWKNWIEDIKYLSKVNFEDKWDKFIKYPIDKSFLCLKTTAKYDSPREYYKINQEPEENERMFETIQFNKEYLLDIGEKLIDNNSIVSEMVNKWYSDNSIKILSIIAPYGVGKTSLVHLILAELKPLKVLIISYRQTLTYDLFGNFNNFDITSYLEATYNINRLICQVDSLMNVVGITDQFGDEIKIINYDLIILDESESVINHLFSKFIKEKKRLFDYLCLLLKKTKKILLMDGDYHNRSYEFVNGLGNHIILENTCKKNDRKYIFTNDENDFQKRIEEDLKNGQVLMIVSMEAKFVTLYNKKYEGKYKCILHTSETDDQLKKELKDVNNFWINYQLIMYSPTIEAGLNFNRKHVNKMYIVLSKNSVAQRPLLQMCSRCRMIEDKTSYVYLNDIPFIEHIYPYTFEQTEVFVKSIYNEAREYEIKDDDDGNSILIYKNSLYNRMLIYHEQENLNKQNCYFIPILLKMIKQKGSTYEYIKKEIREDDKKENKNLKIKEKRRDIYMIIVNAQDIDKKEFTFLINKQKANQMTKDEKLKLKKEFYKRMWKVDTINEEFMEKNYGKTQILYNLKFLIKELRNNNNKDNIEDAIEEIIDENLNEEDIVNYNKENNEENNNEENNNEEKIINNENKSSNIKFENIICNKQKKIIVDLIEKLGFENVLSKKEINRNDFLKGIKNVFENSLLLLNKKENYALFSLNKNCDYKIYDYNEKKYKNIEEKIIRPFIGFINKIFNNFGCELKYIQKNIRKEKIIKSVPSYKINICDGLEKYI